ncbi:hypothetical protein BLOT_012434, partial [Blomia tropicalis]
METTQSPQPITTILPQRNFTQLLSGYDFIVQKSMSTFDWIEFILVILIFFICICLWIDIRRRLTKMIGSLENHLEIKMEERWNRTFEIKMEHLMNSKWSEALSSNMSRLLATFFIDFKTFLSKQENVMRNELINDGIEVQFVANILYKHEIVQFETDDRLVNESTMESKNVKCCPHRERTRSLLSRVLLIKQKSTKPILLTIEAVLLILLSFRMILTVAIFIIPDDMFQMGRTWNLNYGYFYRYRLKHWILLMVIGRIVNLIEMRTIVFGGRKTLIHLTIVDVILQMIFLVGSFWVSILWIEIIHGLPATLAIVHYWADYPHCSHRCATQCRKREQEQSDGDKQNKQSNTMVTSVDDENKEKEEKQQQTNNNNNQKKSNHLFESKTAIEWEIQV